MAAILPLAAGCAETGGADSTRPLPGLEVLADLSPPPAPAPEAMQVPPAPPPAAALPFPESTMGLAQAGALLAQDPMALRFLALKQLAAEGLVAPEQAAGRRQANLGGLLPLTAPLPPAQGLTAPIPAPAAIADRFRQLWQGPMANAPQRQAERDFMLEQLLPAEPGARENLAPVDLESARKAMDRLDRVKQAGLVTGPERDSEAEALTRLMASGALPEKLLPPPPPEPPKPPPEPKKTASGRGARMPGGVSGKLEVIPSPPSVEAPRLTAAHKGPAGIHLLSMGTAGHGDKAWEALKKDYPDLAPYSFTVQKADLGELGVTYRLIAGPMPGDAAEKLCGAIRAKGQACQPTPFPAK